MVKNRQNTSRWPKNVQGYIAYQNYSPIIPINAFIPLQNPKFGLANVAVQLLDRDHDGYATKKGFFFKTI
jgi:hypothetical protein